MTRALPATGRLLLLVVLVCAVALAGCRRRAAEVAEYHDPHPLPEDPLVIDAPSLGQHGGRFVFAVTGNPRTFNALMANETSSTDLPGQMFIGLATYDNGTP